VIPESSRKRRRLKCIAIACGARVQGGIHGPVDEERKVNTANGSEL